MNTINITIQYDGDITLNNEHRTVGPVSLTWFPGVDLVVETDFERIVVNEQSDAVITPQTPTTELTQVPTRSLRLVKNNLATYVIVDDKFAYKLPMA